MNRRGVVYLLAALFLVAIALTLLYGRELPTTRERNSGEIARITTMSDFLNDILADAHRATAIAGFRAFIALEEYLSEQGAFLPDPIPAFTEAFLNGTIDGQAYEVMSNSTFNDYLARVNVEAGRIGINLNASVANITLAQRTPWSVDITFNLTINLTDTRSLARWDTTSSFTTTVSIIDIRDPVYSVSTYGKVPNTFRISPYNNSQFVTGNDTSVLEDELTNNYYREDPHAPDFLQRLVGNLSGSSKYGIASLVDLDDLNAQGLSIITTHSVVDYLYFGNASTTNYCPQLGTLPSWFKLDATHYNDSAHDYEVPLLNATIC